jgi:hypothetical protein
MAKRYNRLKGKQLEAPEPGPPLTPFSILCNALQQSRTLQNPTNVNLFVELYKNNVDLTQPFTIDTFQEATFLGYRPASTRNGQRSFTIARSDTGYTAYAATGICTWVVSGVGANNPGDIIYGWYAYLSTANQDGTFTRSLLLAQAFDQPIAMNDEGASFSRIFSINSLFFNVPRPAWYRPGVNMGEQWEAEQAARIAGGQVLDHVSSS